MILNLDWLTHCDRAALRRVMCEYGHFIHRFAQYIALVIGHSENERVRRLLIGNLADEIGTGTTPAHFALYQACAASCGTDLSGSHVSSRTREIEAWFFDIYNAEDTARSLAALGPGTEEIAQGFLDPLEHALRNCFPTADLRYFDAHRPEMESAHISNIREALTAIRESIPVEDVSDHDQTIEYHILAAHQAHSDFWSNLDQSIDQDARRTS